MRPAALCLLALTCLACTGDADRPASPPPQASSAPSHLVVQGAEFRKGPEPFEWRGISAFRLAEMLARGREGDAIRYLEWASSQQLTVVRVFLMAHHLFKLSPEEGRKALPRLLTLAAERGLHVEIVALADTAEMAFDHASHVQDVGTIAAAHHNAIVEIANEPWHPTQDTRLHDPAYVRKLADAIPPAVPVALGSAETNAGYAAGRYATWHSPRLSGDGGWQHVAATAEGRRLMEEWKKPVVSDEPIGAAAEFVPGRRDNEPRRFNAAAAVTRLAGMGATFHYEGGLQARIPAGVELSCFSAWTFALEALRDLPAGGRFVSGDELAQVADIRGARAAFGRVYDNEIWIVAVDPRAGASASLRSGTKLESLGHAGGVRLYRGRS